MGVTNSNKLTDVSSIECNGTFNVTLGLSASPDIVNSPTDIVLILDKSGSMAGVPFESLKEGARSFIDIIDESTDGTKDGTIGSGSAIGIVGFSSTATEESPLTTSVSQLNFALDNMVAGGSTNHQAAFALALSMMDFPNGKAKVMVMFTDGKTTSGFPPEPTAQLARDKGVIIYCIGLSGVGGIDTATLEQWSTQPAASYVSIAPTPADLELIFAELAANISKPGATGITIDETLDDEFLLLSVGNPSKGTVTLTGSRSLKWTIDELGTMANENAILQFTVQHVGATGGTRLFNKSITYNDNEGSTVVFPNPTIDITCDVPVIAEPCPPERDVFVPSCRDFVCMDVGDIQLQSQGRILRLDVTINNVCPNREVAMAVILTEKPENIDRGMKVFRIPAHSSQNCRDVVVKNIIFILPEDNMDMCRERNFTAKVLAHYATTDYICASECTEITM